MAALIAQSTQLAQPNAQDDGDALALRYGAEVSLRGARGLGLYTLRPLQGRRQTRMAWTSGSRIGRYGGAILGTFDDIAAPQARAIAGEMGIDRPNRLVLFRRQADCPSRIDRSRAIGPIIGQRRRNGRCGRGAATQKGGCTKRDKQVPVHGPA